LVCPEVSKYRVYRDDLPSVSISRLRALDIITAEMTEFVVRLGHIEKTVSLHLRKWPSGGSWSWFGCPTCGKWARTLRLHLNNIVCPSCCARMGIRPRASTLSIRQRAERRIPQLRAMLETETSLRLKSHHLRYSKLERRKRLEAALARCEFIVSRGSRFLDVLKQTEIEPEPVHEPKVKTTSSR
jgi:hypothetical protein